MIRSLVAALVLALCSCQPAFAQTVEQQIDAARAEINAVENAADRAVYACTRRQIDKCLLEARAAANAASRALYRIDRAKTAYLAEQEGPVDPHDGHEMPDPPAPTPLTVADITPLAAITDPSPYIWQVPIPGTAAPDNVGAFRLICNVSHLSYDDPIVYPGQPGKAHLHMFFGNTQADANSTYESLRTSGESTCQGDVLNRSAYWIPALLSAPDSGKVVVPDHVGLYYKRFPASVAECSRAPHIRCAGIPAGLRAIFGTNYVQGHLQSPHVRFDCNSGRAWDNLADTAAGCRGAAQIYARIEAPECWNGRDLDSANHQDHLAYMSRDVNSGRYHCPATHPVVIPKLSLIVVYAVLAGDTPATWVFSSDVQAEKPAGTTFHADYMEAWEPAIRLRWEAHCIDKLLNCSAAVFGDGTQGKTPRGFTFEQRPHLVPVPPQS
jgi:hypothetical protein